MDRNQGSPLREHRNPEKFGPFEIVVDERLVKNYAFAQDDPPRAPCCSTAPPPPTPPSSPTNCSSSSTRRTTATPPRACTPGRTSPSTRPSVSARRSPSAAATWRPTGAAARVRRHGGRGARRGRAAARPAPGHGDHAGAGVRGGRQGHGARTGPPGDRRTASRRRTRRAGVVRPRRAHPGPPAAQRVCQEQMYVFSWGGRGFSNIHTDLAGARRSGMDRTIAQAMQQVGYVSQMMGEFHGPGWLADGHLSLKFIRPFYVGDAVTARGAVLGPVDHDGRRHLESEVWVENEAGEKTAVGWAHAPWRRTGDPRGRAPVPVRPLGGPARTPDAPR
ncbi:MaoC family dehydratase [Streptomyces sp. M19]